MSLVMIHEGKRPVVRVGRFAGQYAKPRSKPAESRDGVELPSYFGDLVNRPEFTAAARRADPENLVVAYSHAAMTLNFIRSLSAGGFADVHHPEYWELSFFRRAGVPDSLRVEYERTTKQLAEALRFMEALGESSVEELTRVDFYTSHEGLSLPLRVVADSRGAAPRRLVRSHHPLSRGLASARGRSTAPTSSSSAASRTPWAQARARHHGRSGPAAHRRAQPAKRGGQDRPRHADGGRAGWATCCPGWSTPSSARGASCSGSAIPCTATPRPRRPGLKTRDFDDILREVELTFDVHEGCGTPLGGVHFEMTGEDVTECIGAPPESRSTTWTRTTRARATPGSTTGKRSKWAFASRSDSAATCSRGRRRSSGRGRRPGRGGGHGRRRRRGRVGARVGRGGRLGRVGGSGRGYGRNGGGLLVDLPAKLPVALGAREPQANHRALLAIVGRRRP